MKPQELKLTPRWRQSKEEIWQERFDLLTQEQGSLSEPMQPKGDESGNFTTPFRRQWLKVLALAALILLILMPSAALLYTREVIAPRGSHRLFTLPDGSRVELNAESRLRFKPLWWIFQRHVQLNGEAYFEVTHGNTFSVHSPAGIVSVLGTCFNVYDRDCYQVTCLQGKVKVADRTSASVTLSAQMQARMDKQKLIKTPIPATGVVVSWRNNQFSFVSTPLIHVIEEIERQYDIRIERPDKLDYIYTGNFSKISDPAQVLRIIERPFGIRLHIK